jgi:hypothetical protein
MVTRDQEIPTAAFRFWLVFWSFPQSDCGIGNRRMYFIPLWYYTGVSVSMPVISDILQYVKTAVSTRTVVRFQ